MTLTATDVLTPLGEIDGALFFPALSSGQVTTRVTSYLTSGYAKATALAVPDAATADAIARTFTYYRAWSDVVNRLTLAPASASLAGEVSTSYLQTQINAWITARDAWRLEYQALLPVTATSGIAPTGTRAVPIDFRF